jgi:cysteinyl-tRNA synthetase
MLFQQELELQLRNEILANHVGKIFNAYVWNEMVNEKAEISKPSDNPDLITDNSTQINDFIVQVVTLKTAYRVTNNFIENSIRSAENLIAFLKKEYYLK